MNNIIVIVTFVAATGLMILAVEMTRQFRRQRERFKRLLEKDAPAKVQRDSLTEFFAETLPRLLGYKTDKQQDQRFTPENAKQKEQRSLFIQAGFYREESMAIFHGARLVCLLIPIVGFVIGWLFRAWDFAQEWLLVAVLLAVCGFNAPTVWLNRCKRKRQATLRRTLPDALDIIMICLEGGLTLAGALIRVAGELRSVHPDLAVEMLIVQRHIQLGKSAGEALRQFADRCDLEEVRSLASAVLQSERFGASLVSSLRVQADMLRLKRMQQAEERAHRASVQVLFPTLLLIFPAVFIVLIGPAGLQIIDVFNKMNAAAAEAASVEFPPLP